MNRRLTKWLAIIVLGCAAFYVIGQLRADSVREYLTSAQSYWRNDRAVITLTTATEVRTESLLGRALRKAGRRLGLAQEKPDLRVGSAYVFTYQNGAWLEQKLPPQRSPEEFSVWPYDGRFYTWQGAKDVSVWNGQALLTASPRLASELRRAFPGDPNNYVAAGSGPSPRPYDVLQDPITLDQWHSYRDLASLPDGMAVAFPVGGKIFEIVAHRDPGAKAPGGVSLTVTGAGQPLALWQAQPAARAVSRPELARFLSGLPLDRSDARDLLRGLSYKLGGSVVGLMLLWAVFFKPAMMPRAPAPHPPARSAPEGAQVALRQSQTPSHRLAG